MGKYDLFGELYVFRVIVGLWGRGKGGVGIIGRSFYEGLWGCFGVCVFLVVYICVLGRVCL